MHPGVAGRRVASLALAFMAACQREPGSSEGAPLVLRCAAFGRRVRDAAGERLASPLTTLEDEPAGGDGLGGGERLAALAAGVDVEQPVALDLAAGPAPAVVPRNAVIALRFSEPLAPGSVVADELDAAGGLVAPGSVQVRRSGGAPVAVRLLLARPDEVWIDAAAANGIGLPASPLVIGADGEPLALAPLEIRLPRDGPAVLRSASGAPLSPRDDRRGEPDAPLRLAPGNAALDFVAHGGLLPQTGDWNGFLPDRTPPRIVRDHAVERVVDFAAGDAVGRDTLRFASARDAAGARGGRGEWAGATLFVRPGAAGEERLEVLSNDATTLRLAAPFAAPPRDGERCRLVRRELFEPDPADPIDPARIDPANPENDRNAELARFVAAFELDGAGEVVAGPLALDRPLPSRCELRLRFSEPVDPASLLPWESLRVAPVPDDGRGELLVEVALARDGCTALVRPVRTDPATGAREAVGFGPGVRNLELIVTSVARAADVARRLAPDAARAFLDEGWRGIVDLGGEPLARPPGASEPLLRWRAPFVVSERAATLQEAPPLEEWRVAVHRLRGRPRTGIDPASGLPCVRFRDVEGGYRPIPDVNLFVAGALAGAPVVHLTKFHDEEHPPPTGAFVPVRWGQPEPLATHGSHPDSLHDGCRFQTVWRDVDCSPNRAALAGTLLDLWRVSFSPAGGSVVADHYEDVSIHCAHSPVRPSSAATAGVPSFPLSGLSAHFDLATWLDEVDGDGRDPCPHADCAHHRAPNHWDALRTVVPPGTSFQVGPGELFAPPHGGRAWHPWPAFAVPFAWNNGDLPAAERELQALVNARWDCDGDPWREHRRRDPDPARDNDGGDSLLFEVRIRPQRTPISGRNGIAYVVGCLFDSLARPSWRVFSTGAPGRPLDPDDLHASEAARCALGNPSSYWALHGDNSRFLAAFDFVKRTSRIVSPFVGAGAAEARHDWFPPLVAPGPEALPPGTSVRFEFAGSRGASEAGEPLFAPGVDAADGSPAIAFRVTLEADVETLATPILDSVAIPCRVRPRD